VRRAGDRPTEQPRVEELEPRDLLAGGTWAPLAQAIPDPEGGQHMLLLSDGSIMVQGGNDFLNQTTANRWYALKPDATGSYINGTFTTLAAMSIQRQFYGSVVLQNGHVVVVGGEDSGTPLTMNDINTGEMYDPVANTWTPIPNYPEPNFGDNNLEVLPNGDVLGGFLNGPQTHIYHPATNTWTAGGTKLNNDPSSEETWIKLADGSILTYEINGTKPQTAQRYIPSLNQWVFAGNVPVNLGSNGGNNNIGDEEGPAFLLPDGRSFWLGASQHTALYTPPTTLLGTGSWVAGPDIPNNFGVFDGPGCVLPNGNVLFLASPQDGTNFAGPTDAFEYNPATNTIVTDTVPPVLQTILNASGSFTKRLIVLPSGQVMLTIAANATSTQLWVFTPNGGPLDVWRPRISNITNNGNGTFTLSGTQLTGLDEGSLYGDDGQNATNYPVIRVTDSTGRVFYCRTFNWSSTGVAQGNTPQTVQFTLPAGLAQGPATFVVVANGIPSLPFSVNPVTAYFPFRYIFDPATNTFFGNLTLVDNSILPVSGTIRLFFPSLPQGVTLANPAGFQNGQPFLQVTGTLNPHSGSLRVQIRLRNPFHVPLSTFFIGFPVEIRFSP
jgi:hypothetical protein